MEGLADWQSPPLDAFTLIFIDAINVKIRQGEVANRPLYLALGVTLYDSATSWACGPGSTATA